MRQILFTIAFFTCQFVLGLSASAQSSLHATFVSTCGDDANVCSATAPCRTLQAAVNAVAPGGVVFVMNPGSYATSTLTINKSVTIESAAGATALLTTTSGSGIDIEAGTTDVIGLRGLTVLYEGPPAGNYHGILFNSGGNLTVEGCAIAGFPANGIALNCPGQSLVRNTSVRNCLANGIQVYGPSGFASIEKVSLHANSGGLYAREGSKVSIRDSVVSDNTGDGVNATSATSGSNAEINIESCLIANNGASGVHALGTGGGVGFITISNSTVTDNGVGLQQAVNGVLQSRLTNTISGNGADEQGAITAYSAR